MNKVIVSKFGGTSMGSAEAMRSSAHIATKNKTRLTVVSATSGTTNQLLEIIDSSVKGDIVKSMSIVEKINEKHLALAEEFKLNDNATSILKTTIEELKSLSRGMYFLREASPKAKDRLQSIGERLSSLIFTKALDIELKKQNPEYSCETLDARNYIETDNNFTKSRPITERILKNCQPLKVNFNQSPEVFYVTQGFIGKNEYGDTTTLGRGGSDYTASIFGEALDADLIQIWTDVAGIATTDPRICSSAKIIPELSFKEAAEMATFGAKILHPTTVIPAKRASIPVFVGSTFDPDSAGTIIKEVVEDRPLVRSINLRKDQTLITLANPRMLNAHGYLSNLFQVFSQHDISVDAITTSEISVAVTVHTKEVENNLKLITNLEEYGKVTIENNLSIVSIIGNKINHTCGLANKIFESLGDINVRMICQGASLHNFCFLVHQDEASMAVKNLHKRFIT